MAAMRSSCPFGLAVRSAGPLSSFFALEKPRAERVEGSHGELGQALLADEPVEAFAHFAGSFVRESHSQDAARRDAEIANEVCDAVRQDAGLPRPGAGEDEERSVAVGHGGALLRIQRIE